MRVSWQALKAVLIGRAIAVNGTEDAENYYLLAVDGPLSFECILSKGNPNEDLTDFETNYKPTWNPRLAPTVNGFPINRPATTKAGWHYCPRYITWTTAIYSGGSVGALNNEKIDAPTTLGGAVQVTGSWGDAVVRTWKVVSGAWVELKRSDFISDALFIAALLADCTITTMDWESTYDADMRGAVFLNGARPSSPTFGSVIAAPGFPASYGGSIPFLDGGIPLHLLADYGWQTNDALTVKSVLADPVNHTNKFRVVIKHAAGVQITVGIGFQHYRA